MFDWFSLSPGDKRLYAVAYIIHNRSTGARVLSCLAILAASRDEATGRAWRRIQESYPTDAGWDTPQIEAVEIPRRVIDQARS